MKKLFLLLILSAVSVFADSQRFVYFNPGSQDIALYREGDSDFRYSFSVSVSDLAAPQQATVAASLGWLQAQLAEGETLNLVVFEPYQVDESTIGLRAAITGRRDSGGERTISIDSKDVPSEVRTGLVDLWTDLAAVPVPTPTPAPEPTPTPEP